MIMTHLLSPSFLYRCLMMAAAVLLLLTDSARAQQDAQQEEWSDDAAYDSTDYGVVQASRDYPQLKEGRYLALFAGPSVSHSGVDRAIVGGRDLPFTHGNDYGGFGGIAYGLLEKDAFYGIRPEMEFSIAQYQLRDAVIGGNAAAPRFEARSYRFMMNAYYDLPFNNFGYLNSLYVGTGLGFAFYDFHERRVGDSIRNHTDPEVLFGYQFMTGVTFVINERLGFNVGYRYFSTDEASIFYRTRDETRESELRAFELHTHAIEMGVRYGF